MCHVDLRRPPGSRLLEVVPPLEDPLARGEFEFRILILLLFRNQRIGSMTQGRRKLRYEKENLLFFNQTFFFSGVKGFQSAEKMPINCHETHSEQNDL